MPSASELDAVTVDAMGTLVELDDPAQRLQAGLRAHGVELPLARVAAAFRAEVAYYVPRTLEGRDPESLADLRVRCTAVFLEHAGAPVAAEDFTGDFLAAIVFRPLPGAAEALERLRAAGLALACVSNWDVSLGWQLERVRLDRHFSAIVSSAEAQAAKPDPGPLLAALRQLGVEPARALHTGDGDVDREAASAAGTSFEPASLATLPERLGLGRRP